MYFKFNSYLLFFLFMTLTTTEAQVGSKIDLKNVDVGTKALPTIFLFGKEYTFRERNKFIKDILKSQFYLKSLTISLDLEEFITKRVFRFNHKGKVDIYLKLRKLPQNNKYNSFMIDGAAYSELNMNRILTTIQNVRIDSIQNGIKKRIKLLNEITELNNEISDLEISLDKYESFYNDIIVSKKLSERKYKQLKGLEKISVIQKKYKTVKRKIARNKRDLENVKLLVVSIY